MPPMSHQMLAAKSDDLYTLRECQAAMNLTSGQVALYVFLSLSLLTNVLFLFNCLKNRRLAKALQRHFSHEPGHDVTHDSDEEGLDYRRSPDIRRQNTVRLNDDRYQPPYPEPDVEHHNFESSPAVARMAKSRAKPRLVDITRSPHNPVEGTTQRPQAKGRVEHYSEGADHDAAMPRGLRAGPAISQRQAGNSSSARAPVHEVKAISDPGEAQAPKYKVYSKPSVAAGVEIDEETGQSRRSV